MANLIYWFVVTVLFQYNFGLVLGTFLTFVSVIALAGITGFQQALTEVKAEIIAKNRVIILIEEAEHNGQPIWLVYNKLTNKFVLQATSISELAEQVKEKFKDKEIFAVEGSDAVPLATSHFFKNNITKE